MGILILNQDDFVLVGRQCFVNYDHNVVSSSWQMPQGGIINFQEDPLDAAYRELYEETGIKSVSLLGKANSLCAI